MNQKYKIWPALLVFHFLSVHQVSPKNILLSIIIKLKCFVEIMITLTTVMCWSQAFNQFFKGFTFSFLENKAFTSFAKVNVICVII